LDRRLNHCRLGYRLNYTVRCRSNRCAATGAKLGAAFDLRPAIITKTHFFISFALPPLAG
jgi:hypothetical protein